MPITLRDTRLTQSMIRRYTDAGYWGSHTLPDIVERNSQLHPDREAIVDSRERVTWGQLAERSRRVAKHLRELGLSRGDVVAVQLPNWIDFISAMVGINAVGAIICSYGTDYRSREVEFILGFSQAAAVIVPEDFRGFNYRMMIDQMRARLPDLKHLMVVGDNSAPDGWQSFRAITERRVDAPRLDAIRQDANDVMRILFTSGSTGDPKGVLHSYNTTLFTTSMQNVEWNITEDSSVLLFLPVGLNWGMVTVIQVCQAVGRLVLVDTFAADRALEVIHQERVSMFGTAPTGLIPLVNHPRIHEYDLSSLQLIVTAGAACPIDLIRRVREQLDVPVVEMYGMTEVGFVSSTKPDDPLEAAIGTVGQILPWFQPRLIDHNNLDVMEGQEGELVVTGPTICLGYYNNPIRNAESWTSDGWFRTGDIGLIDQHGRLRLVGRKKDMFIHGGANVWPRELEEVLFTHPKIADVAVVGVPDPYFGENACACVVLKQGEDLTLDELISFMRDKVAKYKLPQQMVVMDSFPYTSTGKLQKQLLREQALRSLPSLPT